MIIGSSTSCRKVWASQETITKVFPEAMAAGNETRASNENAIAAHIVPTAEVIFTPSLSRKLFALVARDADLVMTEAYARIGLWGLPNVSESRFLAGFMV